MTVGKEILTELEAESLSVSAESGNIYFWAKRKNILEKIDKFLDLMSASQLIAQRVSTATRAFN